LAGAVDSIIRNDYGLNMHKFSNDVNDDFIILVSDVDEVCQLLKKIFCKIVHVA